MKLAEPKYYTLKFVPEEYDYKKRVPLSKEFTCPERSAKLAEPKVIKTEGAEEEEDFDPYRVLPRALTAKRENL
jgi:hypothetical protein